MSLVDVRLTEKLEDDFHVTHIDAKCARCGSPQDAVCRVDVHLARLNGDPKTFVAQEVAATIRLLEAECQCSATQTRRSEMSELFKVHMLNESGKVKAKKIAEAFDALIDGLASAGVAVRDDGPKTRCGAVVRTKLEEACFFAKKDMANSPENSQP